MGVGMGVGMFVFNGCTHASASMPHKDRCRDKYRDGYIGWV